LRNVGRVVFVPGKPESEIVDRIQMFANKLGERRSGSVFSCFVVFRHNN